MTVPSDLRVLSLRHIRFGWWLLVVFLTLGLVLEGLHGLKVAFYLDVTNHTRRLMWTLAHAHGALLGLIQIAFAASLSYAPFWDSRPRAFASSCLIGAGLLMPLGFFLGGLVVHAGDPSLGILLVPIGAILLLMAGGLTLRAVRVEQGTEKSFEAKTR
jgi:hypothetical protein